MRFILTLTLGAICATLSSAAPVAALTDVTPDILNRITSEAADDFINFFNAGLEPLTKKFMAEGHDPIRSKALAEVGIMEVADEKATRRFIQFNEVAGEDAKANWDKFGKGVASAIKAKKFLNPSYIHVLTSEEIKTTMAQFATVTPEPRYEFLIKNANNMAAIEEAANSPATKQQKSVAVPGTIRKDDDMTRSGARGATDDFDMTKPSSGARGAADADAPSTRGGAPKVKPKVHNDDLAARLGHNGGVLKAPVKPPIMAGSKIIKPKPIV